MRRPFGRRVRTGLAVARFLPAYTAFAVLKHVLPLRVLARLAWREPQGAWPESARERLIACAVRAADVSGLPDRDCLQRSLLLYRALSHAGADPSLSVGFEKTSAGLRGHAWVVVAGRVVGESDAHIARFEPVMRFGARGVVMRNEDEKDRDGPRVPGSEGAKVPGTN